MSAQATVSVDELPYLETTMNFSGEIEGRPRVDVPDRSQTNMNLEPHELRIYDARPLAEAGALSVDREGFTLVEHDAGITAETDTDAAAESYLDDVAEYLREFSGASFVLTQGRGLLKRHNVKGAHGPSRWVHADYTNFSARRFVEWLEARTGRSLLDQHARLAIYQTWRSLAPPPYDNTLTLCDASTIADRDWIVFDAAMRKPYDEPGAVWESQFSRWNPNQRWYYFSDMQPDEMIVFKGYDSDPSKNAEPLHNGIDLPTPGAVPRMSVEARFFAFFD